MNDNIERYLNTFSCLFGRRRNWFVGYDSLKKYVMFRDVKPPLDVVIVGESRDALKMALANYGPVDTQDGFDVALGGFGVRVHLWHQEGTEIKTGHGKLKYGDVFAPPKVTERFRTRKIRMTDTGLWTKIVDPQYPYHVCLPYHYGTILDTTSPGWWTNSPARDYEWTGKLFFDPKRKERGYELLRLIHECAERAGIQNAMWLGFGCMLGYVMVGDFIKKDNDIDICIDADQITKEQEEAYFKEIHKPYSIGGQRFEHGLAECRDQPPSRKGEGGRALWTSIGPRSIEHDHGVKACHWFFWKHRGYCWHSKGGRWINPRKFPQSQIQYDQGYDALCLGQPESTLSEWTTVNFHGVQVKMPMKAGTCLDWWYPGWDLYGEGSSAHNVIMAVKSWQNVNSWKIVA